jgi:hypothetical protein
MLTTLLCNKIVAKSKKVKSGWSTKEGYGYADDGDGGGGDYGLRLYDISKFLAFLYVTLRFYSEGHTHLSETYAVHITVDAYYKHRQKCLKSDCTRPMRSSYTLHNMNPTLLRFISVPLQEFWGDISNGSPPPRFKTFFLKLTDQI